MDVGRKNTYITGLENNLEILGTFLRSIPEEALTNNRGEGIWTIVEHLNHLVITQLMLFRRMQEFTRAENPVFEPFIPQEGESGRPTVEKSAKELIEGFVRWREKMIELVETCEDEVWLRVGSHPEYKEYSFDTLVRHTIFHDQFHMYRMEEVWLLNEEYLKPL